MKFNYQFKFTPDEAVASRKVLVSVNGTEEVATDCKDNEVALEFAINEQVTLSLLDLNENGEALKNKRILQTHKVTGKAFEPDTLEGITIVVSKVDAEPPKPPVKPSPWPSADTVLEDETSTASEPAAPTDPANPDASA